MTLDRLLAYQAFILIAALALLVPIQNDTWWHLAAGRETLRTGHVMLVESWSHTAAGAHWANYEWLSQVLFFALYRLGGLPLLTAVSAAFIVGAYAVIWRLSRGPEVARALLLVAALTGSTAVWAVRPQILTLFLFAVTLALIVSRRVFWLPPLFLVWANLHGAVALGGLAVIAALVAAALTERRLAPKLLAAGALSFAAGFVTPLGWRYWLELGISIGRSRANRIIEWQPPTLDAEYLVFWLLLAALPVVGLARRDRLRHFDVASLAAVAALLAPLAVGARRNVPVFLAAAVPALTALLWDRSTGGSAREPERWRAVLHAGLLGTAAVAAVLFVGHVWRHAPHRLGWDPLSPDAAAAIRSCDPPLYNPYNDGGYLVWFVPEQKVFLDSRQDPYPVSLVQEHVRAELTGDYGPLFRAHGIRCAVFGADALGPGRLRALGWRERFRDGRWVVLEHPESAHDAGVTGGARASAGLPAQAHSPLSDR